MNERFRSTIRDLATTFASSLVAVILSASVEEIVELSGDAPVGRGPAGRGPRSRRARAVTPAKGGRLPRRSAEDIEKALELVVALVRSTRDGLRSEQIRKHLGLKKEELPRVLKAGLSTRQLRSRGEKRSTVYSAA